MTADIVCHGAPSSGTFQRWLSVLERVRGARVASYERHPKSAGRGHFECVARSDGHAEQCNTSLRDLEAPVLRQPDLRPLCYRCPYTVAEGRPGDLSIADFWSIEVTPHARGDDGALDVSLVLANGAAGLRVLPRLDVNCELATLAEALPRNPMLQRPSTYTGERDEPWCELYAGGLFPMVKRERYLALPARFLASRVRHVLKRILGR